MTCISLELFPSRFNSMVFFDVLYLDPCWVFLDLSSLFQNCDLRFCSHSLDIKYPDHFFSEWSSWWIHSVHLATSVTAMLVFVCSFEEQCNNRSLWLCEMEERIKTEFLGKSKQHIPDKKNEVQEVESFLEELLVARYTTSLNIPSSCLHFDDIL